MKFNYRNGLIFISIDIFYNQKQYLIPDCIVDTGTAGTALDIDLIDFDYSQGGKFKHLVGVGGKESVIEQTVEQLIIDSQHISNSNIEFGNIKNKFGINGFIGNNILDAFVITLNYKKSSITLT